MKTRTVGFFGLVIVLSLVLGSTVSAQSTQPPAGSDSDRPPARPIHLAPSHVDGVPYASQRTAAPRAGIENAASPAVPAGQPGLSFRYVRTFGETEEPYLADAQHLNYPNGIFVDGSDNLYVAEEWGQRVLEFNSVGSNVLVLGHAGLPFHGNGFLSGPNDIAVDASKHIWVVWSHAVTEFEADGTEVRWFPNTDPWNTGGDNEHFNHPTGIAFDSAGRLYVSDHLNHRIQVYTFTVDGDLVYSTTIGVTGEPGSDNDHFNEPQRIAVYGDRLYVADAANHRVQIFNIGDSAITFDATIGVAGQGGDDNEHLNWPLGVAVGASYVYVADSDNHRVQLFNRATRAYVATIGTGRGSGNNQLEHPRDVAVDSAGNIYVADCDNTRVQQFDGSRVYQRTYGVTGIPYVTDATHLNAPWGVTVAADGSIFVTEQRGQRLIKLNAAGEQQWAVGQAGVAGSDNAHWNWPEGNAAVDAAGRIYVPDTGNHRIQIRNPNGTYFGTLGDAECDPGDGISDKEFCSPRGVATDGSARIYVADSDNHRIQVFDGSHTLKATLGVTGERGSDNAHFNQPAGVAVDAAGAIYIADRDNHRVQRCTLNGSDYTCAVLAGVTGECGYDFDHLCVPKAVAVDTSGRVYVAEDEHRVQVFDPNGAYLTTLGGRFGPDTGLLRNPGGVAVDGAGHVYVADTNNHRIQVFALGVPGWRQVNINGYGDPRNAAVSALEVFGGQLYAASMNQDVGASVWRSGDGRTWTAVSQPGFGPAHGGSNALIGDVIPFGGQLYAGIGTFWGGNGAQIWRSPNGTTWNNVEPAGFGDVDNQAITAFGVFGGRLYVGTMNRIDGLEIWRSSTGNNGNWSRVIAGGRGDNDNYFVSGFVEFKGSLYAGTKNDADGAEIWRTQDGQAWEPVITGGWNSANNNEISSFAIFGDHLYAGISNYSGSGGQLWRTLNGAEWTQVAANLFGDPSNGGVSGLRVFGGHLYGATANSMTGMQVWRSTDGVHWEQISPDGFGDSNNVATLWSVGTTEFQNRLYIGTCWNYANGGEMWMMLRQAYLPLTLR